MPRNYDAELETILREAFGEDSEDEFENPQPPPANNNAVARRALARALYTQYEKACKGRRVLRTLSREKLSPMDEVLILEDHVRDLSNQDDGDPGDPYQKILKEALAQAKCELAEARWRAVARPERRLL